MTCTPGHPDMWHHSISAGCFSAPNHCSMGFVVLLRVVCVVRTASALCDISQSTEMVKRLPQIAHGLPNKTQIQPGDNIAHMGSNFRGETRILHRQ